VHHFLWGDPVDSDFPTLNHSSVFIVNQVQVMNEFSQPVFAEHSRVQSLLFYEIQGAKPGPPGGGRGNSPSRLKLYCQEPLKPFTRGARTFETSALIIDGFSV